MGKVFFINVSNHPLAKWSENQKKAIKEIIYAYNGKDSEIEIMEVLFPTVDPLADWDEIYRMADILIDGIENTLRVKNADSDSVHIVHVMGEVGLTFAVVEVLREPVRNYKFLPVHSTTERSVVENPDGSKTAWFKFVQFRPY